MKFNHNGINAVTEKLIIVVPSGTTVPSAVLDYAKEKLSGNLSFHMTVTGTGTAEVTLHQSNNYEPSDQSGDFVAAAAPMATGETAGTKLFEKDIIPCNHFRLDVEETGSANDVTVTIWLGKR